MTSFTRWRHWWYIVASISHITHNWYVPSGMLAISHWSAIDACVCLAWCIGTSHSTAHNTHVSCDTRHCARLCMKHCITSFRRRQTCSDVFRRVSRVRTRLSRQFSTRNDISSQFCRCTQIGTCFLFLVAATFRSVQRTHPSASALVWSSLRTWRYVTKSVRISKIYLSSAILSRLSFSSRPSSSANIALIKHAMFYQ